MFEPKSWSDRNCQTRLVIEILPKLFQVLSSLSLIAESIHRFPRIIIFVSLHQVVVIQLYAVSIQLNTKKLIIF